MRIRDDWDDDGGFQHAITPGTEVWHDDECLATWETTPEVGIDNERARCRHDAWLDPDYARRIEASHTPHAQTTYRLIDQFIGKGHWVVVNALVEHLHIHGVPARHADHLRNMDGTELAENVEESIIAEAKRLWAVINDA